MKKLNMIQQVKSKHLDLSINSTWFRNVQTVWPNRALQV